MMLHKEDNDPHIMGALGPFCQSRLPASFVVAVAARRSRTALRTLVPMAWPKHYLMRDVVGASRLWLLADALSMR